MALVTASGTLLTGTGTSAVAVSGLGFQPTVVLFLTSSNGGASTAGDDYNFSFGCMTDQATDQQRVHTMNCTKDTDPSDCNQRSDNAHVVAVYEGTTLTGSLVMTSFDADGFTVTPDDAFPSDTTVGWFALGGTTNVALVTQALPTGTGAFNSPDVGFTPDMLLMWGGGATSINTDTTNAQFGIGATDGTSAWLYANSALDAQNDSLTDRYFRTGASQLEVYALTNGSAAAIERVTFTAFTAAGATFDMIETGTAKITFQLYIEGGVYKAGDYANQTSTGAFSETGIGFTPIGVIGVSTNLTAQSTLDTGASQNNFGLCFGVSDTKQFCAAATARSGRAANDQYWNLQDADAISLLTNNTAATAKDSVDLVSFASDTLNLDQTTTSGVAVLSAYLAIGDAAAASTGIRRRQVIST